MLQLRGLVYDGLNRYTNMVNPRQGINKDREETDPRYIGTPWSLVIHIPAGADPENFSRGGPTLTYNCGSAQI